MNVKTVDLIVAADFKGSRYLTYKPIFKNFDSA
jgi:hypothetical protein